MGITFSVPSQPPSRNAMESGLGQYNSLKPIFPRANQEVSSFKSPPVPLSHKDALACLLDPSYRPSPTIKNTSKSFGRETPAGLSVRANRLNETIAISKISSSKISPKPFYFSRIWACVTKFFSWIWR